MNKLITLLACLILMFVCIIFCVMKVIPGVTFSLTTIRSNPFADVWSTQKKGEILELLKHLHSVTDKYFLMYGTLLGHARHNKQIIPWDDDMDVAMYIDDFIAIKDKLGTDSIELVPFNEWVYKLHFKSNKLIKQYKWSWPFLDIFLFTRVPDNSEYMYCPWIHQSDKIYPISDIYPLQPDIFEGLPTMIPQNPINLLTTRYGNTWKDTCDSGTYHHKIEFPRMFRKIVPCTSELLS